MAENCEKLPVSSIEKSSSDPIDVTDREMLKQIIENQQKILEELRLSRNEQNGKKPQQDDVSTEDPAKKPDMKISNEDAVSHTGSEKKNPKFEKTGKWFVLKHTFKNVFKLEEDDRVHSEEQEHFGITWKMSIRRDKEHLAFYTWCANKEAKGLWSMESNYEVKLLSKNGSPVIRRDCLVYKPVNIKTVKEYDNWGFKFADWEEVMKNIVIDDSFTFEVSFKIKNTTGIYKNNLRSFDDPECSDIVLVVQDKKFHVLKLYLAAHSSYFKAMFLGMFGDALKSEIPLSGIDADDFQNYLEVLYGYNAIDEYTVEGLLMVADMFDTPIIIQKCEEFLLKESKKTMKKKLEMSIRYNLDELKKKCLSEIKTTDDIRRVVPGDIKDLDPTLMATLFEKSLAFN